MTSPNDAPIRSPDGRQVTFVVSARESRFVTVLIGGIVAVAIGLPFVVDGIAGRPINLGDPWGFSLIVAIMASGPIAYGLYWWRHRHNSSVRLVVSVDGLLMPTRADRPIPWSAIERMWFVEVYQRLARTEVHLYVRAANRAYYGVRGSRVLRAFNNWWFGTDLAVPLEALMGEPEDVFAALKEFAPSTLTAELTMR